LVSLSSNEMVGVKTVRKNKRAILDAIDSNQMSKLTTTIQYTTITTSNPAEPAF
jgi:hypothetical protein